MQWSSYSEKLFDTFLHTDDNIIVQACPGAGKTTNIKELWSLTDRPTVYLVFNKHNQLEAQGKMVARAGSDVLTLNGLGHRAIAATYGRVTLDARKVRGIIKNHIRYDHSKGQFDKQMMLERAVDKAKMTVVSDELSLDDYTGMLSLYDLEEYGGMYHHLLRVLDINDNTVTAIDFNDQIRFAALHHLNMPKYDVVLGDEVQDFSPIQALMVSKLQASRYVLVGDQHQSIYGFRGAMTDSMEYLKDTFSCQQLPLSITYRCAQSIVREAAAIFPGEIEAWSESPIGIVRKGEAGKEQYTAKTLVVCRFNRPLITLAYQLLRQNVPCHVRGRDIGDGLVRLVKRQEVSNVRQLIDRLQQWAEVETAKAQRRDDDSKVQSIHDKLDSLSVFIDRCTLDDSPQIVIDNINSLFEQGKGVCLSTIHKAKGLEADSCYYLDAQLKCKVRAPWQAEQEANAAYVAVTRAKSELVYINSEVKGGK